MFSNLSKYLAPLVILGFAATASAQVYTDDFNRPDSSSMGADWAEDNGDFEIQSGRAVGVGFPWDDLNILRNTKFFGTYDSVTVSMDVDTQGKSSSAAGIVIGHKWWGGVATKLQDNDGDGMFDRVFFEAAINAGSWHGSPTPPHFDLTTPIATGSMVLTTLDLDTAMVEVFDASGTLVGTGTANGITGSAFPPVGNEVVIYTQYSGAAIDNVVMTPKISTLTGTPNTLSVAAGGVQTLAIDLGATHASELYLLLGSTSGTTPGTTTGAVELPLVLDPYFIYTLTNPNSMPLGSSFGVLDGLGKATATFTLPPAFAPSLIGATIHHAAVSFTLGATPNVTEATNAAPLDFTL